MFRDMGTSTYAIKRVLNKLRSPPVEVQVQVCFLLIRNLSLETV